MKQIKPFESLQEALVELDNGGRFYNIFTRANDGSITASELAKVAGVIGEKNRAFVFLKMVLSCLGDDIEQVYSSLTPDLYNDFQERKPKHYSPTEALERGVAGENAIVRGVPYLVDDTTKLQGFIMIPIIAGNVTTMTMVPIFQQFNVYELHDELLNKKFIIAHSIKDNPLPQRLLDVGGILKELKKKKSDKKATELYLDSFYYSLLD
ncbi:hypothetical protein [Pleionea sediminis]|uniref:hypothetical protein n=1 Tax=Pleionea sediminis TaxID=2569479 RepID=UPI0011865384|nr:hypothetical protein [Pleionea sediminis]